MEAVIETGRSSTQMVDVLEEMGVAVKIAHPNEVKAIARAKIKTDKRDSEVLAHLLRMNMIPEIGIGGGLTAAALPHHRAYGSVHGGSYRLDHSPSVSGEGQESSFGEELVRHGHLECFHIRHSPGTSPRQG